jgi:oxygen-dependent protoporphyrinogen oxidase
LAHEPKVIVVGAGMAGLTAAHRLKQSGVAAVVVEEDSRPGGRVRSLRRDGNTVEMGAQFIHTNYERTLELCKEFDLEGDLVEMKNSDALVRGSRLHVIPWGGKRIPAISLFSELKMLRLMASTVVNRKRMALERWPELVHLDEIELAGHVRAKTSDEALDYVVRPLMLTYSMSEPEGLSLAYFQRSLSMYLTSGAHCFRNGNDTLPGALARGLDVRFETRVEELLADGSGRVAGVRTSAGDLEASAVIAAIPSPALRGLYSGWAPEQAEFLEQFRYSAMPLVLLEVEMREPAGYWGVVLDRRAGHRVSFVTHPHAKYAGACAPHYLQVWPLGSFGEELLERSDAEIGDAVVQELGKTGVVDVASAKQAAVIRYPHTYPQYRVGMFGRTLRFKASEGRPPGLVLAGDYTECGMIEGAVRSGENAAARVLAAAA